jgi:hypothetical protein
MYHEPPRSTNTGAQHVLDSMLVVLRRVNGISDMGAADYA